jgi:hypothetical protein
MRSMPSSAPRAISIVVELGLAIGADDAEPGTGCAPSDRLTVRYLVTTRSPVRLGLKRARQHGGSRDLAPRAEAQPVCEAPRQGDLSNGR